MILKISPLVLTPILAAAVLAAAPAKAQDAAPSVELAGHRVHQLAVTTTDLPRAIGFFRDTLALPFLFEANNMAFFDAAGVRLMIALDPTRRPAPPTSILYFDAPDFLATHRKLVATGAPLDGPIETVQQTEEGALQIQQFRDPDGNPLAIMGVVTTR